MCSPPSSPSLIGTTNVTLIRVSLMAFSAEVLSAGQGGHAALIPPEVAAIFPTKRPAVVATVNGTEYRSRLMVYGGKTYLGLRKDLLRKIGAGAGDTVQIELTEDHQERIVTEPPELLEALAANPGGTQGVRRAGLHTPDGVCPLDRSRQAAGNSSQP